MKRHLFTALVAIAALLIFLLLKPGGQEKQNEQKRVLLSKNSKANNAERNGAIGHGVEEENEKSVRRIQVRKLEGAEYTFQKLANELQRLHDLKDQRNLENDNLKNEIGEIKAQIEKSKIDSGEIEFTGYENDLEKMKAKSELIIPRFKIKGEIKDFIEKLNKLSKRMDPFGEGIETSIDSQNTKLYGIYNFDFENMPISEIVRYLNIVLNSKYELTSHGYAITITNLQQFEKRDQRSFRERDFSAPPLRNTIPSQKEIEELEGLIPTMRNVNEELQKEQDTLLKEKNFLLKQI